MVTELKGDGTYHPSSTLVIFGSAWEIFSPYLIEINTTPPRQPIIWRSAISFHAIKSKNESKVVMNGIKYRQTEFLASCHVISVNVIDIQETLVVILYHNSKTTRSFMPRSHCYAFVQRRRFKSPRL